MKELNRIVVVCIDCKNYGGAVIALKKTLSQITPHKCLFLTDIDINVQGVEVIKIPKIISKAEYSKFVITELYKYFDTEFCLIIQHDSWVLDAEQWDNEFYNYDVIGAKWQYIDGRNCGNGGFSLKSRMLLEIVAKDPLIEVYDPEDAVLGRLYRRYLEHKYNIKFAPDEVCDKFSFELNEPMHPTFGFHGYFHLPYRKTIVLKRTGAMGDVMAVEPVLHYYYKKGYEVAIDTLPHFYHLFLQHYFPVKFKGDIHPDREIIEINLDMSYESNPKQLHLQSYYDFCGIKDGEIRNPKLSINIPISPYHNLFRNKYAVMHIDRREQEYRNINGVNWDEISRYIKTSGYDIIQLGLNEHEKIDGAIELNTQTIPLMMWIVAGASMFIGIDSGISHVASAFDIPSVIMFGSVDPKVIHPVIDDKKVIVHNHDKNVCGKPFCWTDSIGCTGTKCYIDNDKPPCTQYDTKQVFDAVKKLLCN